jgi:death-on-curing protein
VGVLNEHSIHSAIGRPYSGYHRTIAEKAAALTEALARNHGFVDGNKRTAVYAMDLLLTRSGYKLRDDDTDRLELELEEMILAVAQANPTQGMNFETGRLVSRANHSHSMSRLRSIVLSSAAMARLFTLSPAVAQALDYNAQLRAIMRDQPQPRRGVYSAECRL